MSPQKINIYTGNHKYSFGIQDIISILEVIFTRKKINYKISSELDPECNNFIIEEFTNLKILEQIEDLKISSNNFSVTLIASEFITHHKLNIPNIKFSYFNNFDLKSPYLIFFYSTVATLFSNSLTKNILELFKNLFRITVNIIDILLSVPLKIIFILLKVFHLLLVLSAKLQSLIIKKKQIQINSLRIHKILKFIYDFLYTHLNLKRLLNFYVFSRENKFINHLYFFVRYKTFLKALKYIDHVIFLNSAMGKQYEFLNIKSLGCISPEFSVNKFLKNIHNCKFGVKMTGSLTPYRKEIFNKISQKISFYNKKNIPVSLEGFSSKNKSNYIFSLHPPQNSEWSFASPTRIFRSFYSDFSIPILTKYFAQSPIENLCIFITEASEKEYFIKELLIYKNKNQINKLKLKLDKYIFNATKNNDKIFNNLR